MKYIAIKLSFLSIFCFSCNKIPINTGCGIVRCPTETRSVTINTVDSNNQGIEAVKIEAVNFRTGKTYKDLQNHMNIGFGKIFSYRLFSAPTDFAESGDPVQVMITSGTGKIVRVSMTVSGGKCACSVKLISGPETINIE